MPAGLCFAPLSSKYGVNRNYEDNGRYPLEVNITPEIEDEIAKIEAHIKTSEFALVVQKG